MDGRPTGRARADRAPRGVRRVGRGYRPWQEPARGGAAALGQLYLARVHSHPGEAFHSATDDANPALTHTGALSIVVAYFGLGLRHGLDACAVYRLDEGRWRALPGQSATAGSSRPDRPARAHARRRPWLSSVGHLPADEQASTALLFAALSAAWRADADATLALEYDPLAVSLGLVPDPARQLSGPALKRARMTAGLKVSGLARALHARGWQVTTVDVAAWEKQPRQAVPPASIAALSDELRTTDTTLYAADTVPADDITAAVTRAPRFQALAHAWAQLNALPGEAAAASSLRQLMTIGHARRGSELSVEQWLDVLEALVDARRHTGPSP